MKILIPVVVILLLQYILKLALFLGLFKRVINHSPGKCRLVPGVEEGSEDIQTLSNGVAIITSGLKYGALVDDPVIGKRKGVLYKFDFNAAENGVQKIAVEGTELDNPHGIGIWEDQQKGEVTVFVVNHPKSGEFVERLSYDGKRNVLKFLSRVSDPAMACLNDVTPTGPDSFYVTNNGGCSFFPEIFLPINRGSIMYCQDTKCRIVADNQNAPNGINASPDGKFVYVAHPFTQSITIFKRASDNSLSHLQTVDLGTGPDNIDVSEKGSALWIGGFPQGWKAQDGMGYPSQPSPAQVLRLKVKDGRVSYLEEVYVDNGELIHTSTIANYYNGAMLVGSVSHKLMYCQVNYLEE